MARSLWDAFEDPRAQERPVWAWSGDRLRRYTRRELGADALAAAGGLRRHGVGPGVPVACVLTNSYEAAAVALGVWLAGGELVSLPVPARGLEPDRYARQLGDCCRGAGAEVLLVEERFLSLIPAEPPLPVAVASFESVLGGAPVEPEPPAGDAVAFVQYSSGSTSEPRGCVLTMDAIECQMEALCDRLAVDPERDRGLTWLPLSHDMGFFGGLILCWASGMSGVLSTPERFLSAPRTWVDDCAELEATLTAAPAFSLELAGRSVAERPPDAPLRLRACLLGGERIDQASLERAAGLLAPLGLERAALTPAYGLAEATLAVALAGPGREPAAVAADPAALLDGRVVEPAAGEPASAVVSVGAPLDGVSVAIDGGREVGEIVVRTPSMATGYVGDPVATRECFRDGVLRTRDLGFLRHGELYVVGRIDDVLNVGGRRLHAGDVELGIAAAASVRRGACALVDVPTPEGRSFVVLAEPARGAGDLDSLARDVARAAAGVADVPVDECLFLPRGALPKTPSGKAQRYRCRQLALDPAAGGGQRVRVRSSTAAR